MSNVNNDVTIDAIIERCMLAIDQKRQAQEEMRAAIEAEHAAANRKFWGDRVPAWIGVVGLVGSTVAGGGVLYAKIDDAQARSIKNERRLDEGDAAASKDAVQLAGQLATIKADVAFIKERVK